MNLPTTKLNYNLVQKKWQIYLDPSNLTTLRERRKTIYWGAEKVPLSISVLTPETERKEQQITCKAFLQHKDGKYVLQPLLGILTAQKDAPLPFGGRKSNFIDLIKAGYRKGAIVFVFTPKHVHWSTRTVIGYMYHAPTKQWKKCKFPLPDVVYNRIPTREYERTPEAQECIRRLQHVPQLTLFNPQFFNKYDLYKRLKKSPSLNSYLPETTSLRQANDLRQMLTKYKYVYLKPTKGKAGVGIMTVKQRADNRFILYLQKKKQTRKISFNNLSSLWSSIAENSFSSPYIIQQGIHLAQIQKSPFDFRLLVQKDKQGKWQVAGFGLRVAGVNRITTHVPRGGRIEHPTHVLKQLFLEEQAQRIERRVKDLALAIAKELEGHYPLLGEMSMDIGLDQQGRLWFFEANSKPMKFDEPDIRRRSLNNIIYFAQYLTFSNKKGSELIHAHR